MKAPTGLPPTEERELSFDEQGHLNMSGPIETHRYIRAIIQEGKRFLARLGSCDRTAAGDYIVDVLHAGSKPGPQVLWEKVSLLAFSCASVTCPGMNEQERAIYERDGLLCRRTGPTRNATPMAEALMQLATAITYEGGGKWVHEIPTSTVGRISQLLDELELHLDERKQSKGVLNSNGGEPRLTKDHETILVEMLKTPARCRTVLDMAGPGKPIRNRETVGRLLRELMRCGLVHRPHGTHKGYALTDDGRARAAQVAAPAPNR